MFATPVWLVLWAWFADDPRRIIREYLPPPCRQYSRGHFYGKPELLDGIGMPFAPKVDQDLRQAMSQEVLVQIGERRKRGRPFGRVESYAATPRIEWMNWRWAIGS